MISRITDKRTQYRYGFAVAVFVLSLFGRVYSETTYFLLDGAKFSKLMPTACGEIVSVDREDRVTAFTFTICPTNVSHFSGRGGGGMQLARELSETIGSRTNRCVIVGHSLGGLFALEFRRRYPSVKCSIVALDPSLWWLPEESWQSLDTNDLYVAFATKPQKSPLATLGHPRMTAFAMRYPTVVETFPSATHGTVFSQAITNGLKRIGFNVK